MKKILACTIPLTVALALGSCSNNAITDSKKEADSVNTATIDSAKKADTVASQNSHMADLKPDAAFATAAADGGMLEVALGELAVKQGTNPTIRKLGAMMVKDHSKANEELKVAAAAKGIALPSALSDKCQKKLGELTGKTGPDFDKAYADFMISDHKDDIDEFKKEADKGMDTGLSAWAKGKVPILEHHLKMAEDAKKAVDK